MAVYAVTENSDFQYREDYLQSDFWQIQSYVLIQIYKHTAEEGCQLKAALLVGILNN